MTETLDLGEINLQSRRHLPEAGDDGLAGIARRRRPLEHAHRAIAQTTRIEIRECAANIDTDEPGHGRSSESY